MKIENIEKGDILFSDRNEAELFLVIDKMEVGLVKVFVLDKDSMKFKKELFINAKVFDARLTRLDEAEKYGETKDLKLLDLTPENAKENSRRIVKILDDIKTKEK